MKIYAVIATASACSLVAPTPAALFILMHADNRRVDHLGQRHHRRRQVRL